MTSCSQTQAQHDAFVHFPTALVVGSSSAKWSLARLAPLLYESHHLDAPSGCYVDVLQRIQCSVLGPFTLLGQLGTLRKLLVTLLMCAMQPA